MKMKAHVEVMGENRLDARGGVEGRSSPLAPSPTNSPSNGERRANGRPQLSIQELQNLAERQRKQILYSSKELMNKQEQLMRMHNDFRARLKIQNGTPKTARPSLEPRQPGQGLDRTDRPVIDNRPVKDRPIIERPVIERPVIVPAVPDSSPASPRTSPRPAKVPSKRDQDQYARMLRETYNNMGKLQNRGLLIKKTESDIKNLNNVELAHELKKVRAIFSSKQNELAEAVKKVDVLTHELEKRKNESGAASVPTPERINRRKKIQAAKDELDRLRNELIVRNEMNTQQSQQLQLQRDIIHEKQQELRELNSRINELGSALLKQHAAASGHKPPNYAAMNGYQQRLFNGSYLYDTLSRKRVGGGGPAGGGPPKAPPPHDFSNSINNNSNNSMNDMNRVPGVPPHIDPASKQKMTSQPPYRPPAEKPKPILQVHTDLPNKSSPPMNSPSSSVSSISSASSNTQSDDYHKIIANLSSKQGPPPPPPRTVSDKKDPLKPFDNEMLTILQPPPPVGEKPKLPPHKESMKKPYTDSSLSGDSDKLNFKYDDAAREDIESEDEKRKKMPPPPPLKPKPTIMNNDNSVAQQPPQTPEPMDISRNNDNDIITRPLPPSPPENDQTVPDNEWDENRMETDDTYDAYSTGSSGTNLESPEYEEKPWDKNNNNNGPSEPEEFEYAFADIDEINEIQTDLWSNSDSSYSNHDSMDSDFEDISKAIVPVVISVSPDKMPPPILCKPEKPRKAKRDVVLDPFILLLDAALEGELDTVKDILRKVPDPSRPNPEGITALHNAVCGNHKEVVRYLVEVACDINSADNNGWTPLHCAAFYNDTELCQYLVEHGASVFATTYTDYQTPAHKCSRLDENYDVCFAYLHECKENVGRNSNGLVHGLYDYTKEHEDELPFSCGDEITILRRGDNLEKEWWWARNKTGETGYIPCNLVGNFPRIAAAV